MNHIVPSGLSASNVKARRSIDFALLSLAVVLDESLAFFILSKNCCCLCSLEDFGLFAVFLHKLEHRKDKKTVTLLRPSIFGSLFSGSERMVWKTNSAF